MNYIGHVVFAASWARCSLQFFDEYLKQWQAGMRKKNINRGDIVKHASFLLDTNMMLRAVQYFDAMGEEETSLLAVQCWQESFEFKAKELRHAVETTHRPLTGFGSGRRM